MSDEKQVESVEQDVQDKLASPKKVSQVVEQKSNGTADDDDVKDNVSKDTAKDDEEESDPQPSPPEQEESTVEEKSLPSTETSQTSVTPAKRKPEDNGDGGSSSSKKNKKGNRFWHYEEESSDDEHFGTIEAPVQLMTGKRERKKTDRLEFKEEKTNQEKIKEIKAGNGTKLGDIPNVNYHITRTNSEQLKPLSTLMFGFVTKMTMVKKNMRQFSGFHFDKEDPLFEKREAKLLRFTMAGLKEICMWMDLEKQGTKEELVSRILEFFLKPEPSGKPLPEKKKKAPKKKTGKKRKRQSDEEKGDGDASSKKKKTPKPKKKKPVDDDDDKTEDSPPENDYDSVSSLSPDSDDEVEEEPKKKKQKIDMKKKSTPPPKKSVPTPKKSVPTPKKSATPVVTKKTPTSSKQTDSKSHKKKATPSKNTSPVKKLVKKATPKKVVDSDSSDDEPLIAKKKSAPTEAQIKDSIKKFLDKANLEEVTMKTVCKKVYETYPDFDLTSKKDFIKATVKSIIS